MHITKLEIEAAYRDHAVEGGACVLVALVAASLAVAGLLLAVLR